MIIFKRIEIYGFKSFGEKVEVDFNENVTAIVGPNGSGKSNIVDAVRWVLGESSVKSLRGLKMSDVIFSGGDDKKALGYAQVTLILDNTSRMFPMDFDEISVTRRLFRSDASEYYINKAECLKRDVLGLFMDTGLGKDGYSIIGQGQIESIVNNSPYERKLMLEEAVGIVKYKNKKADAQKDLGKSQINLNRLTDIIIELEERLPTLQKQAEKAEKFVELKNRLKEIEIGIFKLRMDGLQFQFESGEDEKSTIVSQLDETTELIRQYESGYNELKSKVENIDIEIQNLTTELHELITNYETSKTEIGIASSRVVDLEEVIKLELDNVELLDEQYKTELEAYVGTTNEVDNALSLYEKSNDIYKTKLAIADEKKNSKFSLASYDLEHMDKNTKAVVLEYNRIKTELQDVKVLVASKKEYIDSSLNQIKLLESKRDLLKGYENSLHGYRFGVKKITECKKTNTLLQNGLYGAIGEIISTDNKYSEAITKALGAAVEYMVTENENVASECIRLLKQNKWGRVTFLPKNIIKARDIIDLKIIKTCRGYINLAANLVEYDSTFSDIVESLLGRVIIADNLENANLMAKTLKHKYKIVTLDGEVLAVGGALTGGKIANSDEGVIKRHSEIEKIENELIEKQISYDQLLGEYNIATNKQVGLENSLENLEDSIESIKEDMLLESINELHSLEKDVIITKQAYKTVKTTQTQQGTKLEEINKLKKNKLELIDKKRNDINSLEKQIKYYSDVDKDYDTMRETLDKKYNDTIELKNHIMNEYNAINESLLKSNEQRNILNERLNKISLSVSKAEIEIEHLQSDMMEDYSISYAEVKDLNIDYKIKNLDESVEETKSLRSNIRKLGNINVDSLEEYKEVKDRYDNMVLQREDLSNAINELDNIIADITHSMQRKFETQFSLIREEFNNVFKKLFDGGEAKLILTDPEDFLNTGVDIYAQPMNSKPKNISFLSGGQKTLTGIALVFAILKVNPSPFCILDEIDAALDDANVNRLCEFLEMIKNDNQFILITHKKRTMETANTLYGATMGHNGVTKIFSVKMSQVGKEGVING